MNHTAYFYVSPSHPYTLRFPHITKEYESVPSECHCVLNQMYIHTNCTAQRSAQ